MNQNPVAEQQADVLPELPPRKPKGLLTWLKRIGLAGFLFFLIKGIGWLLVFWGGTKLLTCKA